MQGNRALITQNGDINGEIGEIGEIGAASEIITRGKDMLMMNFDAVLIALKW